MRKIRGGRGRTWEKGGRKIIKKWEEEGGGQSKGGEGIEGGKRDWEKWKGVGERRNKGGNVRRRKEEGSRDKRWKERRERVRKRRKVEG